LVPAPHGVGPFVLDLLRSSPVDIIFISDFRIDMLIGVNEWERRVPQTVQLDLEIGLQPRERRSDRIGDTIDYSKVVARIEQTVRANRFLLVEALAEHIAQLVMSEFGSPWVKASVTKLSAIRSVKRLGITVERGTRS
jgi:7,8-dihydroneopterin aldolase/epimerase/oxygenase